jgi:hypothetical protein
MSLSTPRDALTQGVLIELVHALADRGAQSAVVVAVGVER